MNPGGALSAATPRVSRTAPGNGALKAAWCRTSIVFPVQRLKSKRPCSFTRNSETRKRSVGLRKLQELVLKELHKDFIDTPWCNKSSALKSFSQKFNSITAKWWLDLEWSNTPPKSFERAGWRMAQHGKTKKITPNYQIKHHPTAKKLSKSPLNYIKYHPTRSNV